MEKEGIKHKTFCWQRAITIFRFLILCGNRWTESTKKRANAILSNEWNRERIKESNETALKISDGRRQRRPTMNDNDKETFNYPIMKNAFIATTTTQNIFPFTISALGKYWFAASLFPIFSLLLFFRYFSSSSSCPPSCLDSFVALAHKCRPYIYTGNGYTLNCHCRRWWQRQAAAVCV